MVNELGIVVHNIKKALDETKKRILAREIGEENDLFLISKAKIDDLSCVNGELEFDLVSSNTRVTICFSKKETKELIEVCKNE